MNPTILLFDSGIGGLTIYDEIRKVLPHANYLYCFDNAFFPYSEKSEAVLIEQAVKIVQKIAAIRPLDLVVVACNTASTVVLPALRATFPFPIVGTVPAIKPAAIISHSKTIGLLATKGTITRPYVDEMIAKYANHCQVERIGSTALVELVEQKLQTGYVDMTQLAKIVGQWQTHPTLDTVILGCTHFPLVKQELKLLLPKVQFFVDSGEAIAKRVQSLLPARASISPLQHNHAFYTKYTPDFSNRALLIKKWGFEQLSLLEC